MILDNQVFQTFIKIWPNSIWAMDLWFFQTFKHCSCFEFDFH